MNFGLNLWNKVFCRMFGRYFLWFGPFLEARAKILTKILLDLMTRKCLFKINWPLSCCLFCPNLLVHRMKFAICSARTYTPIIAPACAQFLFSFFFSVFFQFFVTKCCENYEIKKSSEGCTHAPARTFLETFLRPFEQKWPH